MMLATRLTLLLDRYDFYRPFFNKSLFFYSNYLQLFTCKRLLTRVLHFCCRKSWRCSSYRDTRLPLHWPWLVTSFQVSPVVWRMGSHLRCSWGGRWSHPGFEYPFLFRHELNCVVFRLFTRYYNYIFKIKPSTGWLHFVSVVFFVEA